MKSVASALALAASVSAYAGNERPSPTTTTGTSSSRRTFVTKAAGFVGASSLGWLSGGMDIDGALHGPGCACGDCSDAQQLQHGHGVACSCPSCGGGGFAGLRPPAASAYERDVGGTNRSADTAALNAQAKETNARLEKSGFKLDTKEEEEARLSSALSSFSYDSNSSAGKSSQKTAGKGYGKDSKAYK
uniref:Uncharacterized protein n=1 Tax=Minutocellus polymorphus TaxID=265543 RepID=A0A6U4F2M9_9STRA|mmetsp:Transcript_8113/g.13438  ORF Transcript_8113/g.13438 Transcript_8113/m.13438 type:complete len:189 (+) Transcript_8113:170-736(+)|eukprot:CAMPEP_0197718472 /NCGR_PEP_ID=MMETSP1434-20131217/2615_1 /TAXON_ID=265543 /ORGANISM="Minutocellus polymorphus, Strain CCMP3303" /LENGTH=188 /DNA_ID=CAMNT_0043303129 /DNA_START=128 /DNA_END=694 /DNA_ORIENTATION=+